MRVKRDVPKEITEKINTVGHTIATLRQSKNMTQEKLAYGVGIAKSYIGYIEQGKANPTIETLLLLATGLDCSILDLLQDIDT
jgi:transcriptional regulator with XRE-family HTH domain